MGGALRAGVSASVACEREYEGKVERNEMRTNDFWGENLMRMKFKKCEFQMKLSQILASTYCAHHLNKNMSSEEQDEIKDYGPVYVGVPAKPAITTKAIWTANRQFLLAHREGNVSVRTHFLSCAPLVRSTASPAFSTHAQPRPPPPSDAHDTSFLPFAGLLRQAAQEDDPQRGEAPRPQA